jgi:2C-methyl-D-erythritol 2,4-cyclodiphosphate synthase
MKHKLVQEYYQNTKHTKGAITLAETETLAQAETKMLEYLEEHFENTSTLVSADEEKIEVSFHDTYWLGTGSKICCGDFSLEIVEC